MKEWTLIDKFFKLTDELNNHNVEYIIIGGFAVIMHGLPRTTEGLDLFINNSEINIENFKNALKSIYQDGEIEEITLNELEKYAVIRYGTPDNFYIDILVKIGEAFSYHDIKYEVREIEGHKIKLATAESLYKLKEKTYREIDNSDLVFLKQLIDKDAD
jgi:predicted nucleotidyltransferase